MNNRALTIGSILNSKYKIERILGEGGFGITYQATDIIVNETVAIKEYFPATMVTRDTTNGYTKDITIITSSDKNGFEKGLAKFAEEAANLAKFRNVSGIVSVKTFFYENNTGYMVMEYIEGITLKEYLASNEGKIPYDKVIAMLMPIMDALNSIHKVGIIHRDISTDNIMLSKDNQIKLIDFGAARYVGNEDEKSLTIMLKEGYAPPEQYRSDAKQGPWTDVYALCATMYRMISGNTPVDSIARVMEKDTLVRLDKFENIPSNIADAIHKGMAVNVAGRYRSIEKLKDDLLKNGTSNRKILILGMICIICMLGVFFFFSKGNKDELIKETDSTQLDFINEVETTSEAESVEDNTWESVEESSEEEWIQPTEEELISKIEKQSGNKVVKQLYCDLDADGNYEMVACVDASVREETPNGWCYENGIDGKRVNTYAVYGSVDLWYADANEVSILESVDLSQMISEIEDSNVEDICSIEQLQFGKRNICLVYICYGYLSGDEEYICITRDETPHVIEAPKNFVIENKYVPSAKILKKNLFYSSQNTDYYNWCYHTYYYPILFLNGEWGEISSDVVELEEFLSLSNGKEILDEAKEQIFTKDYIDGGQDGFVIEVQNINLDNILYNESGLFFINFKADILFPGESLKFMIVMDPYDYSEQIDISPDYLKGVYAYAIVQISEANELILKEVDFGKYEENSDKVEDIVQSVYRSNVTNS